MFFLSRIARTTATVVTVTALVFFFALFFGFIYLYDSEMRDRALEKFRDENQKIAMLISYFFFERRNDIESLSNNRAIDNYFRDATTKQSTETNNQNIEEIQKLFRNFIDTEKVDNRNIFFRMVLLDRTGNVIVDTGGLPDSPAAGTWSILLSKKSKAIEMIPNGTSTAMDVIIKSPCYTADRFCGMLVAFPSWEIFLDGLFRKSWQSGSDSFLYAMMYRNTVLYKLDAGFRYEPDTDYLSKLPATQVLPLYFDKQGVPVPISTKDFGRANNVFIKLPVDHTPFRLVSLTPKRSILVVDQYYQLLMILIILLCVVLIGVIFISFNFFRSKRLEDRLKEEKLRKELVESKNTGLEKEIISRIAVEKELKKAKEQAESANDAKSIFLANMSHELRTPLNGIIGMTELLSEAKTEQERKELIPIVLQSSYTLLTIINEILDLSKIESGKMEIEKNKFELEEALSPSLKSLAMRAQESGIQFYWYVDPEIPKCLIGDQNKLLQVIVNLVSNAIKFTHKGSVVLKIKLNKFEDRQAILTFLVKDSGIGIADDKQKIIFEAFIQADGSVSRKYGGTGLGLSISSKIVRLMGGEINLKSEPGIGSEFTFILPFGYKHINPQDTIVEKISLSTTADIRPGIKILLAEDNKINRILVIKLFDKINALIEPAENGLEAVELYRHHRYDLIFMDMQMPIMDGITATQEIRKIEQKTGRHVPIIAMTANAMKEDREACIAAGMDDFITKPVKKDIVMDIVSKFISPPEKKDT